MTYNRPYIFVNRLVIVSTKGAIAYDEMFRHGVNIIRGDNASGKSTIINFLFYALGGDFTNWTSESERCNAVLIEISVNDAVVTLRRNISKAHHQPMQIFYGKIDEATSHSDEGWMRFGYKSSTEKESFSVALFCAMSIPEVKTQSEESITMHQLLRLIYIDQLSPTESLFRFERFDPPLMKQTIAEVLLGVYDDDLYQLRIRENAVKRTNISKAQLLKSMQEVFESFDSNNSLLDTLSSIERTKNQLVRVDNEIVSMRKEQSLKRKGRKRLPIENLISELTQAKARLASLQDQASAYEFDLADSKQFIQTLNERSKSLEDSLFTRNVVGELPIQFCPQCLNTLPENVAVGHCTLCSQPLNSDAEKTEAKKLKQVIEFQIRESSNLLERKSKLLQEIKYNLLHQAELVASLQSKLDLEKQSASPIRDELLDGLLLERGKLESELVYLHKQLVFADKIQTLQDELKSMAGELDSLHWEINRKERIKDQNWKRALSTIQDITLKILRGDLKRQEEFASGSQLDINFARDTFALDGKNNFAASSNTYFKNAVRFAVFFASLSLAYFRYPRLIICDNMEDKGMEEERSQNFQMLIRQLSLSSETEHQIIFTTSMIAPALEDSEYCVGDHYTHSNKSLKYV